MLGRNAIRLFFLVSAMAPLQTAQAYNQCDVFSDIEKGKIKLKKRKYAAIVIDGKLFVPGVQANRGHNVDIIIDLPNGALLVPCGLSYQNAGTVMQRHNYNIKWNY